MNGHQPFIVIGIDASNINQGGGRTHLIEIINHCNPADYKVSKIIIWGSNSTLSLLPDYEWIKKRNFPALESGLLRRSLWQLFQLDKQALVEGCNILFIPGGNYLGQFKPYVTMNQNLLPFDWEILKKFGLCFFLIKMIILRWTQTWSIKKSNGIIFLSEYAEKKVKMITGPLENKVIKIQHGKNKKFIKPPKPQKSINHYNKQNPYRLLYVSKIDRFKNQTKVVEAVGKLRIRTGWPLKLDLVGPYYKPSLINLNNIIKLWDPKNDWVTYHGEIAYDNMKTIYSNANLAIWASSCETFGIILLEAMACGLPIASTDRGPAPEILGNAGIYFDPDIPSQIEKSLEILISSVEKRSELSKEAFKNAKNYTWDKCSKETFNFLSEILSINNKLSL